MKEKKIEFTKSIMSVVVLLYFMGAILGTILVIIAAVVNMKQEVGIDTAMFMAYAAYIGGPTATAIGFYAWKSKAENLLKIKYGNEEVANGKVVEIVETLSRMGGNN